MLRTLVPCPVVKFICKDSDLYITDANPAFYEYFGKDITYFEDGLLATLSAYNSRAVVTALYETALRGDNVSVSLQIRKANGIPAWIQLEAACSGQDDDQDGYVGVMMDISELKLTHLDLSDSLELYRTALGSSPDIIFEYECEDDICYTYGSLMDRSIDRDICIPVTDFLTKLSKGQLVHKQDIPSVLAFVSCLNMDAFMCRYCVTKNGRREYIPVYVEGTAVYENSLPVKVIGRIRNMEQEMRRTCCIKKELISRLRVIEKDVKKARPGLPQTSLTALDQAESSIRELSGALTELLEQFPSMK